ncbi:hypothetical protein DUI87_19985 [Hirundo rustica rustica]|uniref:Poly [ADP-ribose] polymerase n=1 Tax=Hirundo rustica rustica TaxID=333673 RepID=A0A3M0JUJ4_HIRRU|nr:hypothetical protein DUI87_19985 [Hirundo rustica rustica]
MCDPAVCSFLTQTLCAHGGRLGLQELEETIGLSAPQLHDTLRAAGPRRFLVVEGGPVVVAVTDVRVCVLKECDGCERLHLCKQHLMGRCHLGPSSCKYSHDILNAENRKVLKKYDLSGLSENELQVLLLQNDPFFLPDPCHFYNKKGHHCMQQNNCSKLHVCRHFLLGKCKFPRCIMSHNLLDVHALRLLETGGIDGKIASNFQAICDYKHFEFNREPKKGYVHNYRPRNDYGKKAAVTRVKELKAASETGKSTPLVAPSEGPSSTTPAQSQDQLPAGAGNKDKGPSSTTPAQIQDQLPAGAGNKDKGPSSTTPAQIQDQLPAGAGNKDKGSEHGFASRAVISIYLPSSTTPAQSQDQLPTGVRNKGEGKKDGSSDEDSKDNKKDNCDEICLFYVWKYCKNKDKCRSVHYHLPYKWEKHDGLKWHELPMMEEIEKAYCDPKNSSLPSRNIDFQTMTCCSSSVRRLCTPSSVTKPTLLLTTQWIWYWKNNEGKWIEYGEQEEGSSMTSPSSAIIENLYQADPCAIVPFQTDQHQYELNFKGLKLQVSTLGDDKPFSILPEKRQKEKMKRENGGKEVREKHLFHGTDNTSMKTICTQNFDWRICGSNGTNYGKGSYFARDACYAHAYCQATAQGHLMFVARVLVGDYVKGNAAFVRPPEKNADKLWFYDSCVDDELNPSVFVVFEKHQVYPEYIIEYEKERIREWNQAGIREWNQAGIREQKEAGIRESGEAGIRQQKEAGIRESGGEGIKQQKEAGIRAEEGIKVYKEEKRKCVIS